MLKLGSKALVLALVGLVAWGCASTRLVNIWQEPKFTGPRLTRIMVIDVTTQAGIRRTFEDEFVRQLDAKGVQAVASYTLIPEDGEVPKERLAEAVKASGVQGVIVTRLVRVEIPTQVYWGPYAGPPYPGFYGYYSWAWNSYYDPPQVYTYEAAIAETDLFGAPNETLVWSGTTETYVPQSVKKGISEFAAVIIKALSASHII